MKKRILATLTALVLVIGLLPAAALAAEVAPDEEPKADTLQAQIETAESGAIIELTENTTESITISGKKALTLDLGTFTLTNEEGKDTITVAMGAELTITGSGTVDNVSNGRAAVFNNGTVVLEGGTYARSAEDSKDNTWYVLLNHGTMTIEKDVEVTSKSTYSSMIENGYQKYGSNNERTGHVAGTNAPNPELTIRGGTFSGGLNTVKNDDGGSLTIEDGSFANTTQSAVLNWNVAAITGGSFKVETNYAVVLNGRDTTNTADGGEVLNQGKLTIEDGAFETTGATAIGTMNGSSGDMGEVKISGGEFTVAENSTSIIDKHGDGASVLVTGGTYSASVPTDCMPSGLDAVEGTDGKFTIEQKENAEAAVNGIPYATLADAVEAAEAEGEPVTLLLDEVTLKETITVSKDVTIDLGEGSTITGDGVRAFHVKSGTLTLTGTGTVTSEKKAEDGALVVTSSVIRVGDGSSWTNTTASVKAGLVIDSGVTVAAPDTYGVSAFGSDTTESVVVKGKIHATSEASALSGNGMDQTGTEITVEDGAELTATGNVAIYHPQKGTLTINGGVITGTSGIEAKAGETTVSVDGNPTITATGTPADPSGSTDGSSTSGYAVVMVNNKAYAGSATAILNSGSYIGKVGVVDDETSAPAEGDKTGSLTVKGGSYSESVADYVDASLNAELKKSSGETPYSYYATVSEALAAAEEGDTVTPLTKESASLADAWFKADGAQANEAINQVLKSMGAPEASYVSDCDKNTMWSVIQGTGEEKEYTVKVTKDGAEINTWTGTVKSGAVVYFTFERDDHVGTNELASGVYTVSLYQGDDTTTAVATAEIKLAKVAFDANGGTAKDETETFAVAGDAIELPAAPSRSGYRFQGWSDGTTSYKAGAEYTVPDEDTTLKAEWKKKSSGSSSSGGTSYAVSVDSADNGTVTVSPKNASEGSTVTITVKPDSGYELDDLTVTDKDGNTIKLTDKGDGKYTFTMPDGRVTVEAAFAKTGEPSDTVFTDVPTDAYYYDAVAWAVKNGVTNGTSATTFSPDASCTRAQTVTFLWRAAGSPAPKSEVNPFTDVLPGAYYYDAVLWAVENGITKGTSATAFSPDATVTRGQTVTFLYRANGSPAAAYAGAFADVAADAYYAAAVQWAVENSITNGTGAAAFSPDADCTRGQIVTFLCRSMAE